jgi:anti-sigma regulatory factor (Ser/Thr protein kinase)
MRRPHLEIAQHLPLDPEAPTLARRAVDCLEGRTPEGIRDRARLVISELVTNSFKHAGLREADRIEIRVMLLQERVRIEVTDHGPGFEPHVKLPSSEAAFGRGLFVVDRVADRWGTQGNEGRVWAELDFPIKARAG